MSILKKLFGGGGNGAAKPSQAVAETVIDGVKVEATPIAEGGQFRLCALLSKEIGGEVKTHRLIRADVFANRDDAVEAAFRKAKRVLEEQGDSLFG
ncbi:MAG: hypothetical protein H6878_02905 [Rhodobiaceae bacterium]|nr:hypothetical protein [Rhodobiaceae bacterium]MCC0015234.1 hypothetical protein [Rhodobiaceae bacterium]MCC0053525.1 hypothetical protein [Rhodobiaceae bacterium]